MALTDKEIREHLEPEVSGLPLAIAPDISLAISVKRIADFIAGHPGRLDIVEYLGNVLTVDRISR